MTFEIRDLSYHYGHSQVLDRVNLRIDRPGVIALLGPNGSGKSTLLKLISGILPWNAQSRGHLLLDTQDLRKIPPAERARKVAYVAPEHRAEFPLTAYEVVKLGRICQGASSRPQDERAVQEAMELALSWRLRDREFHTLSGGERQLVALARALAQGARVLLLDEALSKMDLDHQSAMGRLLRRLADERGYSVVLVAHDINLASEWADRCVLLKSGAVVADGPTHELMTVERISALYPGTTFVAGVNPKTGAPKIYFG